MYMRVLGTILHNLYLTYRTARYDTLTLYCRCWVPLGITWWVDYSLLPVLLEITWTTGRIVAQVVQG